MELDKSKTKDNLLAAFSGEAMAYAKYMIFSDIAKNEGYEQIAEIFEYTANNELHHATLWLEALGMVGNTLNNLTEAARGENYEWSEMYKEFEETAKKEGFSRIAKMFELTAKTEANHEDRYNTLIENLNNDLVFNKNDEVIWECRECGYQHYGEASPKACPLCKAEQAFFQVYPENYK